MDNRSTAIVDGLIIDGTGGPPIADGLVLIEEGMITYAGPKRGKAIPAGAEVVDAGGASVLPGLMDVHVHISLNAPANIQPAITPSTVRARNRSSAVDRRSARLAPRATRRALVYRGCRGNAHSCRSPATTITSNTERGLLPAREPVTEPL